MYKYAPRLVAVCALAALLLFAWPAPVTASDQGQAPYRIAYEIAMPRPESHLFDVTVRVETPAAEEYVDFQMPRWSPGRYAVFDFAKNVQEFRLKEAPPPSSRCAQALRQLVRLDTQTWRAYTCGARRLAVAYKVFADDLSGTFSQLDDRHANFNGASVFAYVVGRKQDPVSLKIEAPRGWKIINGYSTRPDQTEFEFPNYDVLIDTPTEIAPDWTVEEFVVDGKRYRVVVHSFGGEGGRRREFVRDVERIVRAQFTAMPRPDFDSYTFIFHFDTTATRGDGMEHLNSTQIIETGELADRDVYWGALETASHEFFHVWNVKRLRPVELGPWDFTRPLATRNLWIAEGLTNYLAKLFMRRAGLWDDEQLFRSYAYAVGAIENAPGSRLTSAEEASLIAPFLDRSEHAQRTNLTNTTVSYYTKGETLGLVLDLLVRGRTGGRASLEDVLLRAYDEFYLKSPNSTYYLKGRGYTAEEFERTASEATGLDLADFFARHVRGTEPPPYAEALGYVGLRLVREPESRPYTAGVTLDFRETREPRIASVQTGSAAERAGLRQGDVLLTIGRSNVTAASWRDALNSFKPGERVPVTFRRARRTVSAALVLPNEPERHAYRVEPDPNATPRSVALRDAWLKGRKGGR